MRQQVSKPPSKGMTKYSERRTHMAMKKKGYRNGGKIKPKGMKNGGKVKPKGMKNGGEVKPKGMAYGGKVTADTSGAQVSGLGCKGTF